MVVSSTRISGKPKQDSEREGKREKNREREKQIWTQFTNIYIDLILNFEKSVEGSAVEPLSKASNHKHHDISQMTGLHQQVYFILTVDYYPYSMLVVSEKLHLDNIVSEIIFK